MENLILKYTFDWSYKFCCGGATFVLNIILSSDVFLNIFNQVCFNCIEEWGIGRIIHFLNYGAVVGPVRRMV